MCCAAPRVLGKRWSARDAAKAEWLCSQQVYCTMWLVIAASHLVCHLPAIHSQWHFREEHNQKHTSLTSSSHREDEENTAQRRPWVQLCLDSFSLDTFAVSNFIMSIMLYDEYDASRSVRLLYSSLVLYETTSSREYDREFFFLMPRTP